MTLIDRTTLLAMAGTLVLQVPAPKPPTTAADVGSFDAAIVRRAAALIATPAQWDRASTGECPARPTRFSLQCALQEAADSAGDGQPAISDCRFHGSSSGRWEGSCGPLFDEDSIFLVSRADGVKTGVWRKDAMPRDVFAGTMSDPASPVMYEAQQLVTAVTTKKYSARLVEYNNDPDTTFADLQKFFALLETRVIANGAADFTRSTDAVEIEIYGDGSGVIRTYVGWFPVTGFSITADTIRFQFDGKHEVPGNAVDREILERASMVITSEAVWNRADNRQCPADAKTWSIYCAVEKAMIEVTGGFNHRRPAGQLVRQVVDTRSKGRDYQHRMMDYNNDPRTQLSDVRSLFAEAIARIK
ncbi:MAG TPA: hypothetical protein VJN96_03620 [Vicinamibacterales bacterium]|nr:hypothetical protein [Vicinamibacterales bacterium]